MIKYNKYWRPGGWTNVCHEIPALLCSLTARARGRGDGERADRRACCDGCGPARPLRPRQQQQWFLHLLLRIEIIHVLWLQMIENKEAVYY